MPDKPPSLSFDPSRGRMMGYYMKSLPEKRMATSTALNGIYGYAGEDDW